MITDRRARERFLPFLAWLPLLRDRATVRADLMAGLTGAIVVLPQGVAFATLAGMPPEYGLYSAMVPCMIAALFGASRLMVTGPANAISLTVLGLVGPMALPGSPAYVQLVLTLTFMVGFWQLAIGVAGLGRAVDRVPHSVIVGFTAGAAILIVNSQVRNLFGFDWPRGLSVWQTVTRLVQDAGLIDWPTAVVAFGTVAACLLARPWNSRVPYMLVGVLAGGALAALLAAISPDYAVTAVDQLPGAIPPLSAPTLSIETLRMLLVPSLVMTLLALAEAISIARAIAIKSGDRLEGNREVIGQGLANLVGSFFSSYPASGSFNRSGVNVAAGARTPMSAVAAAGFLLLLLAFVAPLSRYLPMAAVAGILLMVAVGLIDLREIRHIASRDRRDAAVMATTFLLVLTIPLEWAILSGIAVHAVLAKLVRPAR
ncbi:MAG: SulP family inorganic anion transporter [Burkholderiales bacterium]|nr:MAG: SulP family inorganic anion transporter [Burkholderiales bacterium]